MSAELNIPEDVVRLAAEQIRAVAASCCETAALAAGVAGTTEDWMGEATAALNATAPLVVAAELERLAAAIDVTPPPAGDTWRRGETYGRQKIVSELLVRASELRGE